jgi:SpoVK/Ycf46/Vps4 family AAA+-type ATPase
MLSRAFIERLLLLLIGGYITYYVTLTLLEKNIFQDSLGDSNINSPNMPNLTDHEKIIPTMKIDNQNIQCDFDNIKGHDNIKEQIFKQVIKPLQNFKIKKPKHALLQPPNGIIFFGPPGTGKTMLTKALCKSSGFNFINFSTNVIENKLFGESSKLVNALFTLADKIKPCIVFIDEIDGFFSKRNDLDQGFVTSLKTYFYTKMDGIMSKDSNIVFIGATNRLNSVDPAMLRRMRLHINVGLPDWTVRKELLKELLKGILKTNIELSDKLDYATSEMSGSDITEFSKLIANETFNYDTQKFDDFDEDYILDTLKKFNLKN